MLSWRAHLLAVFAAFFLGFPAASQSADLAAVYPQIREVFPTADAYGGFEGTPPSAPVFSSGQVIGYVFLTSDVVSIPAYSGKPINNLVGFDLDGRITGVAIVEHDEPILAVGITPERLNQFIAQYSGKSVFDRITIGAKREGYVAIDAITGATITAMVENSTIMRAARQVAIARGLHRRETPGAPAGEARAWADLDTAVSPAAGKEAAGVPMPPGSAAEEPVWVALWKDRVVEIGVLVASLAVLFLILVFQDWLARYPRMLIYVRNGFHVFTLLFIGWYALAQLSVINVLTFVNSVTHKFQWENFLVDPMLFILWSFVAVTLLLWGRGVYCGWLCPFGALQELILIASRHFKLPEYEFSDVVHERLWAVKYILLIVLFGVSLQSLSDAAAFAEVEPFKTAITLRFQREWEYVAYAAALIVIAAFNRKFYCKYLCTLGAALAIPGRFRLFDWWLRRRRECGRPCQVCAHRCSVRAIRPTGEINANECHYCLDCQVIYYNDQVCVPLIERRKRREARIAGIRVRVEDRPAD